MATTTSEFQIYPDFFKNKEECDNFKFTKKQQSNQRYRNFSQTHFTAGDEEQFEEFKWSKNNLTPSFENEPIHEDDEEFIWEKYSNIDASSVYNTFKYMFCKFKKGIFVKIVNNQLKVFLPFSNPNFINEWSENIDESSIQKLAEYACKIDGRKYNEKNINSNKLGWYSNNYLIRFEYPVKESDTNVCVLKNMLDELCSNKKVPDIEFFINKRDFPLHTTNCSEPYFDIWNSESTPLKSHNYEKYSPIFSMCKTNKFEDILIPTHEDWARIQSVEGKYFPGSFRSSIENDDYIKDWDLKKSMAVFRGSSTGKGITIEDNMRLKVSYMSSLEIKDPSDGLNYLDAGITKWNVRPRKLSGSRKLKTIEVESLPFGLSSFLTFKQQSEYKYIIHIDGHVSAFRLSLELSMKSVVLLVESEWKIWYSNKLIPYVHYVPVKKDLSDLIEQIIWCKNNDDECRIISKNAYDFYNTFLSKEGVLNYCQQILFKVKKNIGEYFYFDNSLKNIKSREQLHMIKKIQKRLKKKRNKKIDLESIEIKEKRFHGLLKALQILFLSYKNYFSGLVVDNDDDVIIYSSKSINIKKVKLLENFYICRKIPIDKRKEDENIHEAFIGIFCINEILKEIPNFCFTLGLHEKSKVVVNEYIQNSISLYDYIKSSEFDFNIYIFIILQLCLTLQISQNKFNFVHYDLSPWNILLQQLDEEITIDYKTDFDKCFQIKTKILPIIIDYGKSYCSIKKHHRGYVKLFTFSTSQDILSLLITSIYEIICRQHLPITDFHYLLKLSNFLSENNFRKEKFRNSKELKAFLLYQKKYSVLIDSSNKFELKYKTPMDLFYYIYENFRNYNYSITQKNPMKFRSIMMKCDGDLFYNLLLKNKISNTYFEERIKIIMKDDKNSLNCILSNYLCFLGIEKKKFYKKIKRKFPIAKKHIANNNCDYEIPKHDDIFYDEKDFFSIETIKKIKNKILNLQLDKNSKSNNNQISSKNIITKRNNLTNILDFKRIIKKLIENNPCLKKKFTEL